MPRRINVNDVRQVLEQIVAEDPARRDERVENGLPGRYVAGGKPNCLVAIVLTRLGFRDTILKALDEEYALGEISPRVRVTESRHPALRKIAPTALYLLQYVQDAQDRGEAWGRIVRDAFSRPYLPFARTRRRKPWLFSEMSA